MEDEDQTDPSTPKKSIEQEDRIDEFGITSLQAMGYPGLSDNLITIYKAFKRKKDQINPGRLTAEGLAFVAVLAELADGKLLNSKE